MNKKKEFRISENNVIDNLKMQHAKSVERKVIFINLDVCGGGRGIQSERC